MPSYANLPIPPAALAGPRVLGGSLACNRTSAKRGCRAFLRDRGGFAASVLLCLIVGVAAALAASPGRAMAQEKPDEKATQQVSQSEKQAGGDAPLDSAEAGSPLGPADAAEEAEPAPGQPAPAPAGAKPQIESRWARALFNLILLVIFLAVVIGPFYLGRRLTEDWRQPLWGWPIGLILLAAAVAAAVFALRWIVAPLPEGFGSQLEEYLETLAALQNLWIAIGLIAVPMWLGAYLSRRWRMPDYSGRIGIVAFALLAGLTITILGWPPKLGIDLQGGMILVYEFQKPGAQSKGAEGPEEGDAEQGDQPAEDKEQAKEKEEEPPEEAREFDVEELVQAIARRVDPGNVMEITIRPYGERQIEVIIPHQAKDRVISLAEIERIKKKISSAGTLGFRILANERDHPSIIERASRLKGTELKVGDEIEAWWVRVAAGEEGRFSPRDYPEIARRYAKSDRYYYEEDKPDDYEFMEILVVNDPFNVTGKYLVRAAPGLDQRGGPCVRFEFNATGGQLFGGLTGNNLPEEGQEAFTRKLGIILDGDLQSAPSIRSTIYRHGEITGDFTPEQVDDLIDILNAGSLPTALSEKPISEMQTGPTLGRDTIQRGQYAIGISMVLVLLFMLVYYRFAGVIACAALLTNLVLILAVMISVGAAFTLPGLAGLVLTVGMAVDANVLIFERIREELARQATLRMAIRNGFGRATTAIVDANLTTLITATVLYVIGTDQIRGFAVTLWLGVVMSMFTAIYCSRVVFDVADRQKRITRLKMLRMLGETKIDFLGMRRVAVLASAVVIAVGLIGVGTRGSGLLDIDFTGGVSVEALFEIPQQIGDIREKLGEQGQGLRDLAVRDVQLLENPLPGQRFIINTSGPAELDSEAKPEAVLAKVEEHIQEAFRGQLAHYTSEVTMLPSGAEISEADTRPAAPASDASSRSDLPSDSLLASADPAAAGLAQTESTPDSEAPADESSIPKPAAKQETDGAAAEAAPRETRALVRFGHSVREETSEEIDVDYGRLEEMINEEIKGQQKAGVLEPGSVELRLSANERGTVDTDAVSNRWYVTLDLPPEKGEAVLGAVREKFESNVYFPSSNLIGGTVARGTRVKAILALLASLICIVAYIWIRFQRVMFGLAAVVALVHDVLITLGMIALSALVVKIPGVAWIFTNWLLIDEFKIGLPVLAAFLTIIGYSLNDTIVVFDRIREVRGKSPRLTQDMINTSINQTLSRTMLTSLTTLLVVVVLYIGGGQGIHTFAFALVIGVIVGTYSSIFVASPVLFWMARTGEAGPKGRPAF